MSAKEVWGLLQIWLPFEKQLWPDGLPTNVETLFWPNLNQAGRVEPDLFVRFTRNGVSMLNILLTWGRCFIVDKSD
jgi:hypothetical protein